MSFANENNIRLARKADIKSNKKLYLCRPNKDVLCTLNGVDITSVSYQTNLKDYDTLSFDLYRYINVYDWHSGKNKLVESNGYEDINLYLLVYLEDIGYFQIQEPEIAFDGDKEYKTVTGYSNEKELEDKDLVNFAVNTGEEGSLERLVTSEVSDEFTGDGETTAFTLSNKIYSLTGITINGAAVTSGYSHDGTVLTFSTAPADNATIVVTYDYLSNLDNLGFPKEYITFFNPYNAQLSLLDLVLEKMPGWSVGRVSSSLAVKRFQFETTSENIYSFLTSTVAPVAECIFVFDTINNTISAYDVNTFGADTNVSIGVRNLINTVNVNCDEDSVYTRFNVRGDNDLTVANVNYGDERIYNLDYFMDTKYMPQSLIDKLAQWKLWRETNRDDFIALSKEIAEYQEKISELTYRVPADADYWEQWDSLNEEALNESLKLYQAQLTLLRVSVDDDPQYDEHGEYIPWDDGHGNVDDEAYLDLLYEQANGYGGYYTYIEIITYIIPNINIAIENLNLTPDQKHDYIDVEGSLVSTSDTFTGDGTKKKFDTKHTIDVMTSVVVDGTTLDDDTYSYDGNRVTLDAAPDSGDSVVINYSFIAANWELYGIEELEGELKRYENQLTSLKEYALEWDQLTPEQQAEHPGGEAAYNIEHFQYVAAQLVIGDANTPNTILYQLNAERTQLQTWKSELEQLQKEYRDTVEFASLEGFSYVDDGQTITFSDDDITIIYTLFHDTDYTNNNILTTSIDTTITTLDVQKDLYDDATSKLVEVSQPQYSFNISMDNLLRLEEFKDWEGDFVNGNYIRVGIRDDYAVKLRIVSISWNPCDTQPDLSIGFSNMITGASGRNDLTYILGEGGSTSKNSISSGKGYANTSTEYVTELLQIMSKMQLFKSSVNNSISGGGGYGYGGGGGGGGGGVSPAYITSIVGDYLQYAEINVGNLVGTSGQFETMFTNYLGADLIVTKILHAEQAEIENLSASVITAGSATIGSIVSDYIDVAEINVGNIVGTSAEFEQMFTDKLTASVIATKLINASQATIDDLSAAIITAGSATIGTIVSDYIDVAEINVGNIVGTTAEFNQMFTDHLTANIISTKLINAGSAAIGDLAAAIITAGQATIEEIIAGAISADYLQVDFANIDTAHINTATLWDLYAHSGIIVENVSEIVSATNYLSAVNVYGDSIIANSIKADRILLKNSDDGLYYSLNTAGATEVGSTATAEFIGDGETTTFSLTTEMSSGGITGVTVNGQPASGYAISGNSVVFVTAPDEDDEIVVSYTEDQTLYNSLNGSVITANSITASKINVSDLTAFNATIAGTVLDGTTDSIHTYGKSTYSSAIPGFYLDSDGQFSIGDYYNFIKFYEDNQHNWILEINTDNFSVDSSGDVSVTGEINATSGSFGGFSIVNNSIYSTGKESLDDNTPGIYMNSEGEINIGDDENFLAFYKDTNNEWHLTLSADQITFGHQDLATALSNANLTSIYIDSTAGDHFRNNTGTTALNVTVYHRNLSITTQNALVAEYGNGAYLQWYKKNYGENSYTAVPSNDSHLSNNGFTYTLSASDVNIQVVFEVELITD